MNRHTFVFHVHTDGPSTLENVSTQQRVRIGDLAALGPQIERWLAELPSAPSLRSGVDQDARVEDRRGVDRALGGP